VLPRIFDPFFTTKEDQNRTGLGLAVAHSIVEQHAGEISVRSTPGEGTEFTVRLPVAAAVEARK
jgi:two-component system, NtrC family, sensor kinase